MATDYKKYFKYQPDNLSKNEKVLVVIMLIVFLVIGYFFVNYIVEKRTEEDKLKISKNCPVTNAQAVAYKSKFSRTVFEYEVKGKTYRYHLHNSKDKILLGEIYRVKYNATRPDIAVIDFSNPVLDREKFTSIEGIIIELDKHLKAVKVKYELEERTYYRWIYVSDLSKFILNNYCKLVYNLERPEIAYFASF